MRFEGDETRQTRKLHGSQKTLADCCYSFSNIALIIGFIISIVVCIIFLSDDPLYEYGEHLLSLKFYRQIVYVLVILPLALFVPLYNAFSVFFRSSSNKASKWRSSTRLYTIKVVFQMIVAVLVLIGLIFVLPNTRWSGLTSQLGYELRKHMKFRYDNDFSYQFIDTIQREYQCCDLMWYRANFMDKIPTSCYVPNGYFSNVFEEDCVETLATLVSNRCIILSLGLALILISLVFLIIVDVIDLVTQSSGGSSRQSQVYTVNAKNARNGNLRGPAQLPHSLDGQDDDVDENDNDNDNAAKQSSGLSFKSFSKPPKPILKDYGDERQVPLMSPSSGRISSPDNDSRPHNRLASSLSARRDSNDSDDSGSSYNFRSHSPGLRDPYNSRLTGETPSPLLTRAHCIERTENKPNRFTTKSTTTEMFEERRQTNFRQPIAGTAAPVGRSSNQSASQQIKKSISFQDIDDTATEDDSDDFFRSKPHHQQAASTSTTSPSSSSLVRTVPRFGPRKTQAHSPETVPPSPLGVRFMP